MTKDISFLEGTSVIFIEIFPSVSALITTSFLSEERDTCAIFLSSSDCSKVYSLFPEVISIFCSVSLVRDTLFWE